MPIVKFPPIDGATPEGIVGLGGDLHPDSLLLAYKTGIFPWPITEDSPMAWFCPDPRGVLINDDLYISKRLKRYLKDTHFTLTANKNFDQVIRKCQLVKRPEQEESWISEDIIQGYTALFNDKYAYSIEVWNENRLVGGIYGVYVGSYFTGESMFHLEDNASKYAIIALSQYLKSKNVPLLDTQMVTPVVASLGGKEINREVFLNTHSQLVSQNHIPDFFSGFLEFVKAIQVG